MAYLKAVFFSVLFATASMGANTQVKAHKTCVVRAHDPEVFLTFFMPNFIKEKMAEHTYMEEAVRMFQEVQQGILSAKLTKRLQEGLKAKGYSLVVVDGQETREFVESKDNPPSSRANQIMGITPKADELILSYGLSFKFAIKPVRNDRKFIWRLSLSDGTTATDASYTAENLFRFGSTDIATAFTKALAKLPPCTCDVVVTDDGTEGGEKTEPESTHEKDQSNHTTSSNSDPEV